MNAKDLMVYDWVDAIIDGELRHTQLRYTGDIMQLEMYEILPIPISVEILKANGFKKEKHDLDCYMTLHCGSSYIFYFQEHNCIRIDSTPNELFLKDKMYVHELQHALRLCGFNDLANNLKIKETEE